MNIKSHTIHAKCDNSYFKHFNRLRKSKYSGMGIRKSFQKTLSLKKTGIFGYEGLIDIELKELSHGRKYKQYTTRDGRLLPKSLIKEVMQHKEFKEKYPEECL